MPTALLVCCVFRARTCLVTARVVARHDASPVDSVQDVVDLVVLAQNIEVEAGGQGLALVTEARRRGLTLPDRFGIHACELWEPRYRAEAARTVKAIAGTVDEALVVVCPFPWPTISFPF